MTIAPLPPLPRALHLRPVQVSKTGTQLVPMWEEDQMQAYALAARADLEAENQRLREALRIAINQNEHDMLMTGEELRQACAALKGSNHD